MPLIRLLGIVVLCSLPCAAWAQPWADAYRAGDYRKAVDLLQPLVISVEPIPADSEPARHLAMLYAQGLGVARDAALACAMAQTAASAPVARPSTPDGLPAYKAQVEENARFVREHCDGLTRPELGSASRARGCPAFGMQDELLTVGSQTVSASRAGIRLADAPAESAMQIIGCLQIVARLRAVTIEPPADAAPGVTARHFVEVVSWRLGSGASRFVLQWQMYEVGGAKIGFAQLDELYSSDTYPQPALPADFDARSSMEMIRSGHVRWRVDGAPPKRGWIMLPEEPTR